MHHPAGMLRALQRAPGPHAPPCRDAPSIATWTGTSCITLQGCCVAMSIGIPCITLQGCSEHCNVHWDLMHHPAGMLCVATCTRTPCIALQGCSVLQRALQPHAASYRVAPSIATCTRTPCTILQGCSEHCNVHWDPMPHTQSTTPYPRTPHPIPQQCSQHQRSNERCRTPPPRAVPTSRLGGPPTLKTTPPSPPAGECVIALKSMIGSTAQQFLTYLSHRGEETGNIRGSMKVRVPAERLGTRERLYGESWGWEMGGLRAPPTPLRAVAQLSSPPPFPSIPSQSGSAWIRTRRRAAKGGPR